VFRSRFQQLQREIVSSVILSFNFMCLEYYLEHKLYFEVLCKILIDFIIFHLTVKKKF
jgi:hypothetical protein